MFVVIFNVKKVLKNIQWLLKISDQKRFFISVSNVINNVINENTGGMITDTSVEVSESKLNENVKEGFPKIFIPKKIRNIFCEWNQNFINVIAKKELTWVYEEDNCGHISGGIEV